MDNRRILQELSGSDSPNMVLLTHRLSESATLRHLSTNDGLWIKIRCLLHQKVAGSRSHRAMLNAVFLHKPLKNWFVDEY